MEGDKGTLTVMALAAVSWEAIIPHAYVASCFLRSAEGLPDIMSLLLTISFGEWLRTSYSLAHPVPMD